MLAVQIVKNMTDSAYGEETRRKITDDGTHDITYYGLEADHRVTTGTSQISVIGADGDAAAITTSVNGA